MQDELTLEACTNAKAEEVKIFHDRLLDPERSDRHSGTDAAEELRHQYGALFRGDRRRQPQPRLLDDRHRARLATAVAVRDSAAARPAAALLTSPRRLSSRASWPAPSGRRPFSRGLFSQARNSAKELRRSLLCPSCQRPSWRPPSFAGALALEAGEAAFLAGAFFAFTGPPFSSISRIASSSVTSSTPMLLGSVALTLP